MTYQQKCNSLLFTNPLPWPHGIVMHPPNAHSSTVDNNFGQTPLVLYWFSPIVLYSTGAGIFTQRVSVLFNSHNLIYNFVVSCSTSSSHPSAHLHFSPVTPLLCQVHLLFLSGCSEMPSPHELCASQHFDFLQSTPIACIAEKAHATQQNMVIYCPLHASNTHWFHRRWYSCALDVRSKPQAGFFSHS